MSLCGTDQNSTNPFTDNLILSGTRNGVIKAWRVPQNNQTDPYGSSKD